MEENKVDELNYLIIQRHAIKTNIRSLMKQYSEIQEKINKIEGIEPSSNIEDIDPINE